MAFKLVDAAIDAKGLTATEKLVLIVICRYADKNRRCFPTVATIANRSELSERSIQRALNTLETMGFLKRHARNPWQANNFEIARDFPSKAAPKMSPGGDTESPPPPPQSHPNLSSTTYQKESPVTVGSSSEPSESKNKILPQSTDFDAFWDAYPRKVAKLAAEKAYRSALKKTSADSLLAGAIRYARERRGQDPVYTAHASTWLNRGSWLDEPPKPRSYNPATTFPP